MHKNINPFTFLDSIAISFGCLKASRLIGYSQTACLDVVHPTVLKTKGFRIKTNSRGP